MTQHLKCIQLFITCYSTDCFFIWLNYFVLIKIKLKWKCLVWFVNILTKHITDDILYELDVWLLPRTCHSVCHIGDPFHSTKGFGSGKKNHTFLCCFLFLFVIVCHILDSITWNVAKLWSHMRALSTVHYSKTYPLRVDVSWYLILFINREKHR